jgi:DNA polymerase-1
MTVLLIDSNAVCHRARHAMKGSQLSHNEMKTEVIFSFMNQLYTLAEVFNTSKFVFVWDSRESKRRKICPDYKRKTKEKTPEEIEFDNLTLPQFDTIRCEVLPNLGFNNIFMKDGYEADDIIAALVMKHPNYFTIISRDNDLYQLLFYADMYDPQMKKTTTKTTFFRSFGILPSKWAMVKAIGGCKSDNVRGVDRVGEITAVKYLKGQLKEGAKTLAAIEENKKLIDFNLKLVKLPLAGMNGSFRLCEDQLTVRKFLEVFTKLGFRTFLADKEFPSWERLFNLK